MEAAGPSRLPSTSYQVPEPIDDTPQQYNHEPQQFNHEPTISMSTNGNGVSSQNSPDFFQTRAKNTDRQTLRHSGGCLNSHVVIRNPPEAFAPCPCERCVQKSHSVHIGPLRFGVASQRQVLEAVIDYLSQWGYVEDCQLRRSVKGTQYAFGRYAAEDSTHLAVRGSGNLNLSHPLLYGSKVTYPFFSKYYRDRSHSRQESEASEQMPGNRISPFAGSGNPSMSSGSPHNQGAVPSRQSPSQPGDSQQPRFGSRLRTHLQRRQAASTAINTTPTRNRHQRMLGRSPTANKGVRTQSMMQPGPAHEPSASLDRYSGSISLVQGPWNGAYPQEGAPFQQEAFPVPMHYGPPPEGFQSPGVHYSWPHMPVPVDQWGFQYPPSPTHMAHHGSFDLQQQSGSSGFPVPMQHTMPHPPVNEGIQPPVLPVPAIPASVYGDTDVSTQPGNSSGGASMQTKPPSENEAFEDVVTVIGGSNHSSHSSVGSIAIRVRIPETPAPRSETSVNSPVRRITFGDMPPNVKQKEPEESADTRDQSVIIPDRNRVSRGSPVRRITFGDMSLESEQKAPEEPAVTIPDYNRVKHDSPVRSVNFGNLGASNSPTPGPSEPAAPIPAPVPTHIPVPVVQTVIEGNRIPTLADEWVPQGYYAARIHHAISQQSTNMHRNTSQASTVASISQNDPAEMPFLRQLEEMNRLKARTNQGEDTQSQRNQGDIRLDPDFSGTVIRRRPREHGRIKPWMTASNRYTDTQAPAYPEAPQPYAHNTYQPLVSEPLEAPGPSKPKPTNKKRKNKQQSKTRTTLGSQPSTRPTTPLPQTNPVAQAQQQPPPPIIPRPQTPVTPTHEHIEDSNLYDATPPRRDRKGKGKAKATAKAAANPLPSTDDEHIPAEQALPDLISDPATSTNTTNTRPHTPATIPAIPSGSSSSSGNKNAAGQAKGEAEAEAEGEGGEAELDDATPTQDRKGKGKGKGKAVSGGGGVGVGAEQARDHASGDGQT